MSPHRIRTALFVATFAAAGFAGPASHADVAKELPVAGCATFTDPPGDANPYSQPRLGNDPDLDLVSVTLRTTSSALVAYAKVVDLKTGPAFTDGHRFGLYFDYGGHTFSASGSAYKNGTGAVRDTLAQTGLAAHTTQFGVDVPSISEGVTQTDKGFKPSGLVVTFDPETNYVVWSLPIADVVRYAPGPFTGKLTRVNALASTDEYAVSHTADEADAPVPYAIGDNHCFGIATRITLAVLKYPATRTVTARLTTTAGQTLSGKAITFLLNGKRYATYATGGSGVVTLLNVKPGYTVTAQFAGGGGYFASSASTKV